MLALGKHNPRLADIRGAVRDGQWTSDGLLPIEGPKLIAEAVRSGLAIPEAYVRRGSSLPEVPADCAVYELDESAFRKIQDSETSQGVVALARLPVYTLGGIVSNPKGPPGPIVVLAALQDPGNVGTILRTAEAFGAVACLGLRGTVSVYNPKAVRASAGSLFRVPHLWDLAIDAVAAALRSAGVKLVATSPKAPIAVHDWDWTEPAAILIGNEGSGLAPEVASRCDALLRVPHHAGVESLNSAIAAAVTLYEAYRQREGIRRRRVGP